MWRIGVLLGACLLLEFASGDVKPTDEKLIQRFKRAPYYCDNYYPPPPPPPPPPPYWGPPRWHHGPPPPPPPPPPQEDYQVYSAAQSQAQSQATGQGGGCDNCEGGGHSVSNAESHTGEAIAVAVAKASAH